MQFNKASNRRLTLATVPRESDTSDRLLDNSRQMVRLDLIDDNPRNPRTRVDDESLRELAMSIADHGLLQAPVVRRNVTDPNRYVVVLGARRIAAHRLLGRDEVEVIVRRLDDHQAFLASCVENVQRVELSPREEMDMIGVLIDELGSQEAVARALGKSPTWLSKRKRVLATPLLAAAVEHGEISLDHAYDILSRSPDEATALTQLERVRMGDQNQGSTRDTLISRGKKPTAKAEAISDRNQRQPHEPASTTDIVPLFVSDRNSTTYADHTTQAEGTAIGGEISVRNLSAVASGGEASLELVAVESLVTARLLAAGVVAIPRMALLDALYADLRLLEGKTDASDAS